MISVQGTLLGQQFQVSDGSKVMIEILISVNIFLFSISSYAYLLVSTTLLKIKGQALFLPLF